MIQRWNVSDAVAGDIWVSYMGSYSFCRWFAVHVRLLCQYLGPNNQLYQIVHLSIVLVYLMVVVVVMQLSARQMQRL